LFTENDAGPLHQYYQPVVDDDDNNDGSSTSTTTNNNNNPPPDGNAMVALMHVEVEAWVTEPEKVSARMSNQFHFTFAVITNHHPSNNTVDTTTTTSTTTDHRRHSPPRLRKVLPSNIDEAKRMATRIYLEQQQQSKQL
jgi:hypothetical protein